MVDKDHEPKKKSRRWLIIIPVIVLIILVLVTATYLTIYAFKKFYTNLPKSETVSYVSVLKDASAEISYARATGNHYNAANNAYFGMRSISASFPENLGPYANSVFDWGKKVADAAFKNDTLSSPEAPDAFKLSLSNKDALDIYNDTLSDINNLKTFGDYSLAKKNRGEMAWIAARIQSEQILLNSLTNVTITDSKPESKNIAYAATIYGPTCYYGRGHVLVFSRSINKSDCIKKLSSGLDPVRKAAQEYATSETDDANSWNDGWNEIKGIGVPISTVGATVGDDNFATPPAMKAFQDACKAIGGDTPAGATMDRLPISESGQICTYEGPKGGFCWHFLTDSGKPFSGGDGDCAHENLLPVNTQVANPQPGQNGEFDASVVTPTQQNNNQNQTQPEKKTETQPKTTQQSFDGTYSGSGSVAEGLTDVTVTISGGNISGRGTYIGPGGAQIGVSITGSVTDSSGNVYGSLSGSGIVQGYEVSGSGNFKGKITGSSMSVNYSVSGADLSFLGSIVLTK